KAGISPRTPELASRLALFRLLQKTKSLPIVTRPFNGIVATGARAVYSKPDHQRLLRTLLRPPRPSHGIAHQPSLTYCRFHSSADIGSALICLRSCICTRSTNMPTCLPIETSAEVKEELPSSRN